MAPSVDSPPLADSIRSRSTYCRAFRAAVSPSRAVPIRAAHRRAHAGPQCEHALLADGRGQAVDHASVLFGQQLALRILHHAVGLQPHLHQVGGVGHRRRDAASGAAGNDLLPQRHGLARLDAQGALDRAIQAVAQATVGRLAHQRRRQGVLDLPKRYAANPNWTTFV